MNRRVRLAGVVLGCVCLLAWLAPDVSADGKKGKAPPAKAKGKGKGAGKNNGQGTGQNTQALGDAIRSLQEARVWLADGQAIYNGHRGKAMNYVDSAISELLQASGTGGAGSAKGKGKAGKAAKGKATNKKGKSSTGTGTSVVKLNNNNNLPAGWEVSNGQLQQAAMLIQVAIGKMKGNDPHAQAASAYAQLALQEINTALTFMNNLAGGSNTGTKKKTKGR